MCEDCERGEALAMVYSRKLDRKGWRPPAKAATVARHSDRAQPDRRASSASFVCERPRDPRRENR